ncbi:MAG: hypothetical protein SGILL_004008 [Bacillariaceae sp.]
MSGFDISKESTEGYCKVCDGVYMMSQADFYPGTFSKDMCSINNRGFVFEVTNKKGEKHLLLSGLPGKSEIEKTKQIEKDTGLRLTVIVTSGDFHHMSLTSWLEAYPNAKFIHSALKFPTTRNGKEILANEAWKKQIELVEGPEIESLKEYEDTVKFVGFNQFYVYDDQEGLAVNSNNPATVGGFSLIKKFASLKPTTKFLAIWVYHVPSKQLLYEHNFAIFFSKEQLKRTPNFFFRMMLKPEEFSSCAKEPLPRGPAEPEECKIHCETMQKIIQLDVAAALDYHSDFGCMCRKWEGKDEWTEEFKSILAKTGEDVADGSAMVEAMQPSRCTIM